MFAKYGPQGDYVDVKPIQRAAAAVGDKGLVDAPSHGVFNTMSLFRNLEVVLTDPYTDEGLYRAMMEYFTTYVKKQARALIEAGADIFEIGGNLATSGVGPKFFKNYVLDYEKQVVDEVRNLGAYSIYHNCGDAAKVMKFYNDINPDCWGYLTPPPFADVDLDEALTVIPPDMVLRGNVDQVEFLVKPSIPENSRSVVPKL